MDTNIDKVILAKSIRGINDAGETLSQHTLRCLEIARTILENLPFEESLIQKLKKDLPLSLAIHDVGKAATGFQKSLTGKRWGHRHEILSASFASTLKVDQELIIAIVTHHKSLPSSGLDEIYGTLPEEEIPFDGEETPIWRELSKEWNQNIEGFSKEWNIICNAIEFPYYKNDLRLSPFYVDKKWFQRGKQSKYIPFEKRYYASLLRGLLITCDHIASNSNLSKDIIPLHIPSYRNYNVVDKSTILRNFQKKTGEKIGHLILRAPTGSGKTIAALLWAQKNQLKKGRIFYILPNIASINSMYIRLRKVFSDNVGLLHSRVASSIYSLRESDDDLVSKIDNQKTARNINSLVREMWFPIRVCTPHQILRYTLHGKGWETMLSEFPNSCFIFDEIHAYEPLITGLIVATAKFLTKQNASCLFLSATLPSFLKKILENEIKPISYLEPDINNSSDKHILEKKRHNLEIIDGDMLSNIGFIVKEIEQSNSNLIVCNTIRSSQIVFDELKNRFHDIVLLHSQFTRKDRYIIEKKLMKKLPHVLVSTQVVEVSLDIDFQNGYFEPAPIDALVQRFGRVNRFGKMAPAKIRIFTEKINAHNIYDKDIVVRSIAELANLTNPLDELDLISVADRVYSTGYSDKNKIIYEQALNHPRINEFQENIIAGTHHHWVEEVINKMDNSIDLLPISLFDKYKEFESSGLKIEADLLLVPVAFRKLFQFFDSIDKQHDPWIIHKPYSNIKGLYFDSDDFEYSNII